MDSDEHFVSLRRGPRDLFHLQNLGRSISPARDGFHGQFTQSRGERATSISSARSSGIDMTLNGLTLAPPVFPGGTKPIQVLAAAPITRVIWPRTSRALWLRTPHPSIAICTRTCCTVDR